MCGKYKILNFKRFIIWLRCYIPYKITSITKNRYPCRLLDAKTSVNGKTTIVYRMLGKREAYNILLEDLLADKLMIQKFNPTEAVKLGVFAITDILFEASEKEQVERCTKIRKEMINSIRGQ